MIMREKQIREALNKHWHASAAGDASAEHDIYDDDAICDYPQSGERILGRSNLQALRSHHPGRPSGFTVRRIPGKGDLWITEYTITYQGRPAYTVSIMEFRNGKVVHETQYFGVHNRIFRLFEVGEPKNIQSGQRQAVGAMARVSPTHFDYTARRLRCRQRCRLRLTSA
jgi:hypothetical protein